MSAEAKRYMLGIVQTYFDYGRPPPSKLKFEGGDQHIQRELGDLGLIQHTGGSWILSDQGVKWVLDHQELRSVTDP